MQDAWYGDKRDLINWGTAVYLARLNDIGTIIQIAFRRLSESERPTFAVIRGAAVGVAAELAMHCHYRVTADDKVFNPARVEQFQELSEVGRKQRRCHN